MKFAIFLLVACLCVSFICAETREKTWGNVRARELGRERVVKITDEKRNTVTIKYPVVSTGVRETIEKKSKFLVRWDFSSYFDATTVEPPNRGIESGQIWIPSHNSSLFIHQIPNEDPIVGLKLIDRIPRTTVEFVEGNIGDKQLTLKLTAEEHDIDVTLIFYHEQQ